MLTEFNKDLLELAETIKSKDNKAFRVKILRMLDKMQMSNTKQFYMDKINKLCELMTGECYEMLFIKGVADV